MAVVVLPVLLTLALLTPIRAVKVYPCSSQIYCQGELLRTVQEARLWPDSKHFVDMSLQVDPEAARQRFQALPENPSREQVEAFVNRTFLPPGAELQNWFPPDLVSDPAWLANVQDPHLRKFGRDLCSIWNNLGRKMRDEVANSSQLYSLLYAPHPVIVPGGRFREFYYWDSYWVVLGLLRCGMHSTVKGMLQNFLHQVNTLGLVPNGGRLYYEGRSQPPLLIAMVDAYYQESRDLDFLRQQLPLLEAEYNFWLNNRSLQLTVGGSTHRLARYATLTNTPRPESYREDVATAAGLSEEQAERLYIHLTSGAESGWDFSSRWFEDEGAANTNLNSTRTADIVPVDLNSILCMNERLLSEFYRLTGNTTKATEFHDAFLGRRLAVQKVFWNEAEGAWFDWYIPTMRQRGSFFLSGLWPLATDCVHDNAPVDRVLDFLQREKWLSYPGGVPTSLKPTGQQWDFPNAWPPLQHMAISALRHANTSSTRSAAQSLAQLWTRANWLGFNRTGHMFEKYDVLDPGSRGGGGEYDVQLGFGWSNGVILDLLYQYGNVLTSQAPPVPTPEPTTPQLWGTRMTTPNTNGACTVASLGTSVLLLLAITFCLFL